MPQTCVLPYMTLSYNESNPEMAASFANQLGVNTSLPDFGSPKCAPFYYPIYSLLSTIGYTAGEEAAHCLQQEKATGVNAWKMRLACSLRQTREQEGGLICDVRLLPHGHTLAGSPCCLAIHRCWLQDRLHLLWVPGSQLKA